MTKAYPLLILASISIILGILGLMSYPLLFVLTWVGITPDHVPIYWPHASAGTAIGTFLSLGGVAIYAIYSQRKSLFSATKSEQLRMLDLNETGNRHDENQI